MLLYVSEWKLNQRCISDRLRFKYDRKDKFSQELNFCIQYMKIIIW